MVRRLPTPDAEEEGRRGKATGALKAMAKRGGRLRKTIAAHHGSGHKKHGKKHG